MTFYGAADINGMLAEFGVSVTLNTPGGGTVKGIVDITDESYAPSDAATGGIVGTVTVTVKTGALGAGLVEGASVTVDGVVYRVQRTQQIDDGALTKLFVAAA